MTVKEQLEVGTDEQPYDEGAEGVGDMAQQHKQED